MARRRQRSPRTQRLRQRKRPPREPWGARLAQPPGRREGPWPPSIEDAQRAMDASRTPEGWLRRRPEDLYDYAAALVEHDGSPEAIAEAVGVWIGLASGSGKRHLRYRACALQSAAAALSRLPSVASASLASSLVREAVEALDGLLSAHLQSLVMRLVGIEARLARPEPLAWRVEPSGRWLVPGTAIAQQRLRGVPRAGYVASWTGVQGLLRNVGLAAPGRVEGLDPVAVVPEEPGLAVMPYAGHLGTLSMPAGRSSRV